MVLSTVARVVALGIVLGVLLSGWLAKYVATLLYGIEGHDSRTLVAAATVLTIVGLLAAWLPARRAARVDPTTALRTD
jgi:ABC-type antimicrobial peptide transport system permease subunit